MASPQLFDDCEDKTAEVAEQFVVLKTNQYIHRLRGVYSAADESMTCDCSPDIDSESDVNYACGEDSDCINRLTNIECVNDECTCGDDCQNQRFQKCQYANTSVFLTENKGYGMKANEFIPARTFLIEYIGDIIDQQEYKLRKEKYGKEGLKHFYFMMIHDDEIIDATKRASMARYCNHSCDPNAYVDKWVVNKRFRMGIFAKRDILKGEEICFDYNVDRYGAEPQTCHCGAANCLGVLGGKTQSESVRLLPHAITEALGVIASDEKKWIKEQKNNGIKITKDNIDSKVNVEFVKSLQLESLEIDEVPKVVGCLMQPDLDLLVISRVFERVLMTTDEFDLLIRSLARMHGLKVIGNSVKVILSLVKESKLDELQLNTLKQVIEILENWPILKTKNSVQASNLEELFGETLKLLDDESKLKNQIQSILDFWSKLKIEYRIPKKLRTSTSSDVESVPLDDKKNKTTDEVLKRLPSAPSSSKKPWSGIDVAGLPPNRVVDGIPLPTGWEWANDVKRDQKYYFNRATNQTTWEKPEWPEKAYVDVDEEKKKRRERERQMAENIRIRAIEKERQLERMQASRLEEDRASKLSNIILNAQRDAEAELAKKREKEETERLRKEKKQNAILERAAAKAAKAKSSAEVSVGVEPKSDSSMSQQEKKWVILFAKYVPHMIKKYESSIGRDNLKLFAKDISHVLANKEFKRHGVGYEVPKGLNEDRLAKVKIFSKEYVHRQIEKIKERKRKRKLGHSNEVDGSNEVDEKKQKLEESS